MFNLKYNFLVLFQIIVNLINTFFLIKVFGINKQTDVYLLSLSIMGILLFLQSIFTEQFIVFYNEIKTKSIKSAHNFFNSAFNLSIIVGILFLIIMYCFKPIILHISASGLDTERLGYLNKVTNVLFLNVLVTPLILLNAKLFNSEMRFSIPYIFDIISPFLAVCAQLVLYFTNSQNLMLLVYAQVAGKYLCVIIGSTIIFRKILPYKLVYYHSELISFFKNSFKINMGGNIYSVLMPLTINNILSYYSSGFISYYQYATKLTDILKTLTTGPSANMLRVKLSIFWPKKNIAEIEQVTKQFLKVSIPIFIIPAILLFLFMPTVLKIFASGKLTYVDINYINYLFLALIPWYLVALLEAPYVLMIFTSRKSRYIIIANTLFILIFFAAAFLLKNTLGIYAIPVSAFLAQLSNITIFYFASQALIKEFLPIEYLANDRISFEDQYLTKRSKV